RKTAGSSLPDETVRPRDKGLIAMNLRFQSLQAQTRRQFLKDSQAGLGGVALATLLGNNSHGAAPSNPADNPMALRPPHFAAKAKHVIYLHMSGAPPQQDLFDYKPELIKHHLQPCPDSLLKDQKFAFIKGHPKLLGTPHKF